MTPSQTEDYEGSSGREFFETFPGLPDMAQDGSRAYHFFDIINFNSQMQELENIRSMVIVNAKTLK